MAHRSAACALEEEQTIAAAWYRSVDDARISGGGGVAFGQGNSASKFGEGSDTAAGDQLNNDGGTSDGASINQDGAPSSRSFISAFCYHLI